jgi:hypothetical protein
MYTPQNVFSEPRNCDVQRCVYSFDRTNTPWLTTTLAAGANISRIPLQLDKDADFFLRAIQTTDNGVGLEFRLEDMKGHPLSDKDNVVTLTNYEYPALYSAMDGAGITTVDNADDYGVFCQQGSRLTLWLLNNGPNPINLTALVVNLHGVKRYTSGTCLS